MGMNKKSLRVIIIELIVLILLYVFMENQWIEKIPQCWVYHKTGLLCPSCGGTRCVIYLLKGNIIKAFFSHSLFFMAILYLLCVNIVGIINLNKEKKILTWIYPKYWYGVVFIIFLIIYTIVRNLL